MKDTEAAATLSVERFLALLLLVLAVGLLAIYFKGRAIRAGYTLNELQQENYRLASLKVQLEAELASINHPCFVCDQLHRYKLCMTGKSTGARNAPDLRLAQAPASQ